MDRWSRGALNHDGSLRLAQPAPPAGFSRGELVRRGAFATAGVAAFGLFDAARAFGASGADPKPIPGGFALPDFHEVPSDPFIHVLAPEIGHEMSTITDFNGVVAASHVQGQARGSDGSTYSFDTDMRFMQGLYVGTDGRLRQGSFGFI